MLRFALILVVLAVVTANFASAGPAALPSEGEACSGSCNVQENGPFSMGKCLPYYCDCHIFNSYIYPLGSYVQRRCPDDQVFYEKSEHTWNHMCIDWYLDPECQ